MKNFEKICDYKIGTSKGHVKITLIGLYDGIGYELSTEFLGSSEIECLCNGVLEKSGGNRTNIIGEVSEIFSEFARGKGEYDSFNSLCMDWRHYYLSGHKEGYEKGLEIFTDYYLALKEKEMSEYGISEYDIEKIKEFAAKYFEHLVFIKTPIGLYLEYNFFKNMEKITRLSYRKDFSLESEGVDGFLGETAISVKPKSFDRKKYKSPCCDNVVRYSKNGNDCEFVLDFELTDELKQAIERATNPKKDQQNNSIQLALF